MADNDKKFGPRIKKKPLPVSKTPPKVEKTVPSKKKTQGQIKKKRLTIDLPHSAYLALKMHVLKEDITARDYIESLIIKDLGL